MLPSRRHLPVRFGLLVYPKLCFYAVYWFVCVYCPERPKKYSRVSNEVQQDSTSFICLSFYSHRSPRFAYLSTFGISGYDETARKDISFTFSAIERTRYSIAWPFFRNFLTFCEFKTVFQRFSIKINFFIVSFATFGS